MVGLFFFKRSIATSFQNERRTEKSIQYDRLTPNHIFFSTRSNNRRPIRCVATRSALVILIICFEFPKENTGFSNSENGWRAVSKRVPPIARITLKDREFNCTHMRNVQITWIMIFLLFMQIPCSG